MTKSDGTIFEIKKADSQMNGGDQQKWKEGWSVNFPADISNIKNLNYIMSTSDVSGTDDNFSAYDQDGNLVTEPKFTWGDNFIKDGKNDTSKIDFSKITKLFRVYTFVLKESGAKSNKIYPTIYISHTA